VTDPRDYARAVQGLHIQGPTLALRYPALRDAPSLFALASDARVTRYFSWGPYQDEQEPRAWVRSLPPRRARGTALEFVVVDGSDTPIGVTLLNEYSARDRRAMIGTWLGRAHWGTGANAETKALVAALGFGPLGLRRLGAYADARNVRSQRALERIGFTHEGTLRDQHRHGGRPRTVLVYSLLYREWRALPLAKLPLEIRGLAPRAFR